MRGVSGIAAPDVLVIGLGPAGASAAASAAAAGASVIAIDRKREPGVPVQCAEFVPAMIGQHTKALSASVTQPIDSMITFVVSEQHGEPNFAGHMIDRAAFDSALVADAVRAGAACALSMSLRSISLSGDVHLSDGTILRPKVIIGADGPRSLTGKAIGRINLEIAETRQVTVPLLRPHTATDIFLGPSIPGGYAWLFPKGGTANLGLGVAEPYRARLKPLLEQLHTQLADEGRVGREILHHTGGAIPVGGRLDPAAEDESRVVLLAGDAAGLTNPITGAGINAAVQSGTLAGRAAARIAAGERAAIQDYRDDIEDLFATSLDRAVRRREALMQQFASGHVPTGRDLKRAWIAFPEYWAA